MLLLVRFGLGQCPNMAAIRARSRASRYHLAGRGTPSRSRPISGEWGRNNCRARVTEDRATSRFLSPKSKYVARSGRIEFVVNPGRISPVSFQSPLTFSFRDDWEAFRRNASEHLSLLSRRCSTVLAKTCAHMSHVAACRICVSTNLTTSTILYARNVCLEYVRLLANHPYRHGVRRFSRARFPGS